MAIERFHPGDYGPKTVEGPAFPDVDENALNDIAVRLMSLGDRLDGEVIPHHAHQRMQLSDWEGEAGRLAEAAAKGVLGSYGDACEAVYAAAKKVFRAESAVVQTKNAVNRTAETTEQVCQEFAKAALQMLAAGCAAAQSGDAVGANTFFNTAVTFMKSIQSLVAAGLAENTAAVAACASGLAQELGVPPGTPGAKGEMPPPPPPPPVQNPATPGTPPPAPGPPSGGPGGGGGQGDLLSGGANHVVQPEKKDTPKNPNPPAEGQGQVLGGGASHDSQQKPAEPPANPPANPPGNVQGQALGGAGSHMTDQGPGQTVATGSTSGTNVPGTTQTAGTPGSAIPASTATRSNAPGSTPTTTAASSGSGSPGSPSSGSPTGQGTGQGTGQPAGTQDSQSPKNPFSQLPNAQPLSAAAPAAPLATPEQATQTPAASGTAAASGASTGTGGAGAAPVAQASASTAAPATGTPAGAAPAAPLGPAPTPSPAAPVAQPGSGAGVPAGPGVAPMSTNQQQNAAAAAPIPVTAARAERDAMAAAARAGLVRKSAGDADVQFAERIAAALHAPPSIPAMAWNFVWAVGVTSDGEIIAANSYGVSFIPDGMCLPSQVIFVSADERIPAGQRGRWVREPFVALQAWCTFHEKTLKVVIGTEQEVQPFAGSLQTRVIPPEDIPTDGLMKGRTRLEVIAPEAAAKLAEWPDAQLHEALPPQPVQLVPPDPAAIGKAWMESIRPLMQTTGETYRTAHLEKLAAYGRLQESAALYRAYTAPYAADLRAAITDWVWWQQFSTIQGDAQLVELGA